MAECHICGAVDPDKPVSWTTWECPLCRADQARTVSTYYEGKTMGENEQFANQLREGVEGGNCERNDVTAIIADAIEDLGIPDEIRAEAELEGHTAFVEKRDVPEALRYWYETYHILYT